MTPTAFIGVSGLRLVRMRTAPPNMGVSGKGECLTLKPILTSGLMMTLASITPDVAFIVALTVTLNVRRVLKPTLHIARPIMSVGSKWTLLLALKSSYPTITRAWIYAMTSKAYTPKISSGRAGTLIAVAIKSFGIGKPRRT